VAEESVDVQPGRQWATLVVALVLIAGGVEGIVRAALSFGEIFGTLSFLWGLTVIAAATSLPDAIVSVRAARNDEDVTSITNVLGSNTFNLLVAIPVGVLLAGSATINFLAAIPTMGFLAFATLVFIVFTRTDLELTNLEAYYGFLGLYVLFLVWMTLESLGLIETVQGIQVGTVTSLSLENRTEAGSGFTAASTWEEHREEDEDHADANDAALDRPGERAR